MNKFIAYAVSFGATLIAAMVGSAASIQAGSFYSALARPSWAPPGALFGPVWTLLYLMRAAAGGMAMGARGGDRPRGLAALFLLQLVLNALWSWTFFKWHSGLGSMITIAALLIAILLNTVAFWRVNVVSGVLMLPYFAWVSFAALLNWAIWSLNRGAL